MNSIERKVRIRNMDKLEKLLEQMSLKEKINQLLQLPGSYYENDSFLTGPAQERGFCEDNLKLAGSVLSVSGAGTLKALQKKYIDRHPHHIPLLFMADIIHGYKTIFPIPLAIGCTFEPEIMEKCCAIAAKESAAAGLHVTFSPMADLVRDARWGRVMESTGEDVYLNSCFARAAVRGYQGENVKEKGKIAACVKHFAAYGAPEGGREYNNVELCDATLKEDYLPAYQAAIDEGAGMVMAAFQTFNRIPATANKYLLTDILRKQMHFQGVVISDWMAVHELVLHGMADTDKEAAMLAFGAGVDVDMSTAAYADNLEKLIEEGEISEKDVDAAVLRVLELKNKLGLFENPYKDADEEEERRVVLCREHRLWAREAAAKSFVLLKNESGLLPVTDRAEKIALIGPYADRKAMISAWSIFGEEKDCITVKEGLLEAGYLNIEVEEGCHMIDGHMQLGGLARGSVGFEDEEQAGQMYKDAVDLAKRSDKVILAIGEHRFQSGEAASRADITIPKGQQELLKGIYQVNRNIAAVIFTGRPLDLREVEKYAKAILIVWFPGTEGGNAIADILSGTKNPSGRLSMGFPYCVGQIPVHYSEFSTGRPASTLKNGSRFGSVYMDIPNEPLYPFGYGLSYTEFQYGGVELDKDIMTGSEEITASVTVKNTGNRCGEEIVQMYLQDKTGSVVRPKRELKGIEKVSLKPGESREVKFILDENMLRFYTKSGEWDSEPGTFFVYIGKDSDTQNKAEFELVK